MSLNYLFENVWLMQFSYSLRTVAVKCIAKKLQVTAGELQCCSAPAVAAAAAQCCSRFNCSCALLQWEYWLWWPSMGGSCACLLSWELGVSRYSLARHAAHTGQQLSDTSQQYQPPGQTGHLTPERAHGHHGPQHQLPADTPADFSPAGSGPDCRQESLILLSRRGLQCLQSCSNRQYWGFEARQVAAEKV